MDESVMGFVPGGKEESGLESGGLGSDPHSALSGRVSLGVLLTSLN